jgi:hypothetical protein
MMALTEPRAQQPVGDKWLALLIAGPLAGRSRLHVAQACLVTAAASSPFRGDPLSPQPTERSPLAGQRS